MIGQLRGAVVRRAAGYIILDVGGVGYRIFGTPKLLFGTEKTLTVYTYLAVRDDALRLYGFTAQDDADFFEELLTVSGIGPKGALQIISTASGGVLRRAIARGDAGDLHKTYGIGRKISEKLVLELKDKCAAAAGEHYETARPSHGDVIEALVALGYKTDEVRAVVLGLSAEIDTVEGQIKEALKRLA